MFTPNPEFDAAFDAGTVIWDENDIPRRTRVALSVTTRTTYTVEELARVTA